MNPPNLRHHGNRAARSAKKEVHVSEILTKKEAANFLKLSARTIDYFVSSGQIPYSRLGQRVVRFQRSRLIQWLNDRENVEFRLGQGGSSKCQTG